MCDNEGRDVSNVAEHSKVRRFREGSCLEEPKRQLAWKIVMSQQVFPAIVEILLTHG
jgi:hypothetical protein